MTEHPAVLVSYAPGGAWTLLVRGSSVLLVAASASDPVVPELWHLLGETTNPGTVRSATAPALADRPYSLLTLGHDGVTATSRGIDTVAAGQPLAEAAVVPAGTTVTIGETFGTLWLPIDSGVAVAGAATVTWTTAPTPPVVLAEPEPVREPWAEEPVLELVSDPMSEPPPSFAPVTDQRAHVLEREPEPAERPEAGSPAGAAGSAEVRGVLVLESGEVVDLDRGAVLGRAPRPPEGGDPDVLLVNLASYGRDVSRQHAEIFFQGDDAFVRDLGSSNGTRLLDPSGRITDLEAGVPYLLRPRSVIIVADVTPVTFRVSD